MTTVEQATFNTADYWRAVRRGRDEPAVAVEPEPYPAPEHTSRDPWPADFPVPSAVASVAKVATGAGWAVAQTYSRGCQAHKVTGVPGEVAHWVALRMLHPETRARVVMVYGIRVASGAKSWDSILLTRPGQIITQANVSEAKGFILAAGRVLPSWVDAITARVAAATAKAKAAPKAGKRTESGG